MSPSTPLVSSRRAFLAGVGAVATTTGCTRFNLRPPSAVDGAEARTGVRLRTYANDGARRDGTPYTYEVHTELWLLPEDGPRELVHRTRDASWTRADLVPGEYELVVIAVSDGDEAETPHGRKHRRFRIEDGESAEVSLTIRSVPWEALVIVAIVVVIAIGVALLMGAEPPKPPTLPPPPLLVPPLLPPVPHVLFLPCDVYIVAWPDDDLTPVPLPASPPSGPAIADIKPGGATDPVVVRFAQAMRASDLGPDTLRIYGPGGPVAVGVAVDEDGLRAQVRPLRPLAPGSYAVRVLGKALHDVDGTAIGYDAQVWFEVG